MADFLPVAFTFLAGLLLGAALMLIGFRLRPKKLSLPFIEFDLAKFTTLTVVQLFEYVTKIFLPSTVVGHGANHAMVLMNAGWMIVCDAFTSRFGVYPSDEKILEQASFMGPQNAEFLIAYRSIYEHALREGDRLEHEFATEYVSRAPALAQRIAQNSEPLEQFAMRLYTQWKIR